jgi:hypothetical protein
MLDNALTTDVAQQRRDNGQCAGTSQEPVAAVLSRVNEILPQLRSRASQTEKLRRMHPDNLAQLTEAGVFNLTRPADVADGHIVNQVLTQIARACPSTSWICIIMLASNLGPALLSDEVTDDIDGAPDLPITGTIAPTGEAAAVLGGYRVSSRWAWNGVGDHSNWVAPTCVTSNGVARTPIMVIVPAAQVRHQDTWHAAGMEGRATKVMELHDVFVPVSRTLRKMDLTGGCFATRRYTGNPYFNRPGLMYALVVSAPDTARHGTRRDGSPRVGRRPLRRRCFTASSPLRSSSSRRLRCIWRNFDERSYRLWHNGSQSMAEPLLAHGLGRFRPAHAPSSIGPSRPVTLPKACSRRICNAFFATSPCFTSTPRSNRRAPARCRDASWLEWRPRRTSTDRDGPTGTWVPDVSDFHVIEREPEPGAYHSTARSVRSLGMSSPGTHTVAHRAERTSGRHGVEIRYLVAEESGHRARRDRQRSPMSLSMPAGSFEESHDWIWIAAVQPSALDPWTFNEADLGFRAR